MPARFDEQYGVFVFSVEMEKKGTRLKLLIFIGVNYTTCPWARKLTHDFQSMFLSFHSYKHLVFDVSVNFSATTQRLGSYFWG